MTAVTQNTINTGLHIIFVIDKSGSMLNISEQMRLSINDFIKTQQELKTDNSMFTCVMFSDIVTTVIDKKSLADVKPLEKSDYVTSGSTALFDAIGMTVEKFKNDTNVLLVVVTDGQENASRKYTNKKSITDMIADVKENKKWNVVYLSCDIDTFNQGDQLGMAASLQSSNAYVNKDNMGAYLKTRLSRAVTGYRTNSSSINTDLNTVHI